MLFYRLNTDWRQDDLIENWSSLIWTERYRDPGDFSLKTADIKATIAALPLGCTVTLGDTREVCIVENHDIERDQNTGAPMLTVSGRSFETFFENRTTLIKPDPIKSSIDDTNATIVNDRTAPFTGARLIDNARGTLLGANEEIPQINGSVTSEAEAGEAIMDRFIARGSTYSELIKVLQEENCGIRNLRPLNASAPQLTLNVYKFFSGSSFNADVALDVISGHFIGNVRYTWSIKDYKTAVYVASKNYFVKVFASGQSGNTGMAHRVDLLDQGDITQKDAKVPTMLKAKGKAYLEAHKKVFLIEGTVSPDLPFEYNIDYGLGDRIKVRGDYGAEATMRIVEYIRSEDDGGETAYPTLGSGNL
jgi:hypothetical protein